jgi:hypothetical protein
MVILKEMRKILSVIAYLECSYICNLSGAVSSDDNFIILKHFCMIMKLFCDCPGIAYPG